jgi:hypothetical protein
MAFTNSYDASEFTQGKFIKGSDFQPGQQVRVRVTNITKEEFKEQGQKLVLHFHETDRGMVLNKTQVTSMINLFGPQTAAWVDQSVILQSVPSGYQGKPTILITPAQPTIPSGNGLGIAAQPAPTQPEVVFK